MENKPHLGNLRAYVTDVLFTSPSEYFLGCSRFVNYPIAASCFGYFNLFRIYCVVLFGYNMIYACFNFI